MAADITDDDFVARSSDVYAEEEAALLAAHEQAIAELDRIREQASVDDSTTANYPNYSLHEAAGIGQYVIPRKLGWKALLEIIHDPVPNIDFSANIYPAFDGILGEHFQSPYLLDPLDDKYESYESLRDNIAAVRNFLMQTYYANTPEGMTPEKAQKSLAEIAAFVGDGLNNNMLYLGLLPNHNPTKPFIDLSRAREKNGKGAQYIYEKILEHQRHSNWMKPFTAVAALFGGKPLQDWMLPSADKTHFRDFVAKEIVGTASPEAIAAAAMANAQNRAADIEARLAAIKDGRMLSTVSVDLDAIGNHLLYTAQNLDEGVAHISEPVRRDAVEIAKDILRKLRVSIGDINILDGLKLKPTDDMATLGAVRGVAMLYERLLSWARGNNDTTIFQHPSIIAATQAIGQLGYLAKTEALRMAEIAGNGVMADAIREQMRRVPDSFKTSAGMKFGDLLDKVESGIDTIINRTQQVSVNGAKVGFSVDSAMGTSLSAPPTAGLAGQVSANDAARRNAQAAAADQLAAQIQAQKIHAQMASAARTQQAQGQSAAQPQQQASRSASTVGRSGLRNAQAQQQRATTSRTTNTTNSAAPQVNLTPAQQMQAQRSATAAATAQSSREREEHRAHEQQLLAQQQANAALAKARSVKIDPTLLKGIQSATSLQGVTGAPITAGRAIDPKSIQATMNKSITGKVVAPAPAAPKPAPTNVATPITAGTVDDKNLYVPQPPTPSRPGPGGGRGY